jgi:ubiquinone/menaquinone biosynthesis C-methylase UbiE
MKKQGFDVRIVEYEKIHNIDKKDMAALVRAVNPKAGDVILDGMCGYGSVGKEVLKKSKAAIVYFLDESSVQIKRAKLNLPEVPSDRFKIGSFPKTRFKKEFFDTVVIKMGLHEVPKLQQKEVLKEVYRILKPEGLLVIWDIMLNIENQKLFQSVIRKKDSLSGFDMLTKERYFFREDEFLKNVKVAGFIEPKDFYHVHYRFSSKRRLESELHGDAERLRKLNEHIRKVFPRGLKRKMGYKDAGDDIQFNILKKIYTVQK